MIIKEGYVIKDAINLMRAHAVNDNKTDYKLIISFIFGKNKLATKKRARIESNYLSELTKDTLYLPHSFGKAPTIALYTSKNINNLNLSEHIDYIGSEDLIKNIQHNVIVPNYLIAFKEDMPSLTKYSRILGPKGLMPTPKQGTIIDEDNIVKILTHLRKGSLKIKLDKQLSAHIPIGVLSMDNNKIQDNITSVIRFVNKYLPSSYIKTNLNNMYIATTHGPSATLLISN
jgi:large subunit ribosomal protein L1